MRIYKIKEGPEVIQDCAQICVLDFHSGRAALSKGGTRAGRIVNYQLWHFLPDIGEEFVTY